ncbi:U-box domain-containing protein 39 isoform X1 [Lolium perenne]|uniref:U-box domain-containing protein 39 isoform X1 n=1 Tax=Lolium perenne TaxID=4522 RepID=UPI0021E9FADD|nr:U-box domain-containing protein 39 isoform X1 [Lolium perenne]
MATARSRWRPFTASSPSPPSSASSSPSSSFTATMDPPPEFLCPISGTLMADPVIVPPGRTIERACIQACAALAFYPPAVADLPSSPLVLIPNVALRSAILNWCERLGLPHPSPLSLDTAGDIVRRLMPQSRSQSQYGPPRQEQSRSQSQYGPPSQEQRSSQFQYDPPSQEERPQSNYGRPPQPASVRTRNRSVSGDDFPQEPKQRSGSVEEEIMAVLGATDTSPTEQREAMASLRQATRETREMRLQLCTPRLLAALRPMLLSGDAGIQANAAAAMVNLSLEAENKVRIVRSGAVSPLVDVLRVGHPEARDHAAGAIYSLAVEDENRAAIGVLGAIPPLLELFASGGAGHRARREAGMALYHVSLAGMNRSKIARTPGVVRTLLATAEARGRGSGEADADAAALRKLSLMILANLAGCPEGRAALMDGGAVAAVVGVMLSGAAAPGSSEEEYCISALYGMSKGSLRFRGLARAAGVEEALAPVTECDGGGVGRDMARRTLRAMRGEDDEMPFTASGILGSQWGDASIVSEGLVSLRRPPHQRGGNHGGTSGSNTTQF